MRDTNNDDEQVANLIGTSTWRDWVRRIPRPVFALGQNDLYSVLIKGTDFNLPIEGANDPAIGFYTTRFVAAENVHAAKKAAYRHVVNEWNLWGYLQISGREPTISVEEIELLPERFRLRSGAGFTFYSNDDPGS